jgi:hypothetical protein
MTHSITKHLIFFGFILMDIAVFSQTVDQNIQQSAEDSVKYVVPNQSIADIKMLTPPEGFVVSDRFNGYVHTRMATAIMMTMIENTSYVMIEKGMTPEFFASNQLVLIEKKDFLSDHGVKGIIYKATFVLSGRDFVRYFVYAGDLNRTLWVAVTYPKMGEELIDSEILKSIQSITFNPTTNEQK